MSNTKLINEAYKYVTPKAIEKSYFGDRAMSSYDRVNALRLMGVKDVPIAMGKQWQLLDQIGDTIKTQYDRLDTAPNDVRTQYAMASYLSQYLGMDYDYALSLTNKSAFAEKVGRKGRAHV